MYVSWHMAKQAVERTHTMIGSRSEDPTAAVQDSQKGIIPKAANELFK